MSTNDIYNSPPKTVLEWIEELPVEYDQLAFLAKMRSHHSRRKILLEEPTKIRLTTMMSRMWKKTEIHRLVKIIKTVYYPSSMYWHAYSLKDACNYIASKWTPWYTQDRKKMHAQCILNGVSNIEGRRIEIARRLDRAIEETRGEPVYDGLLLPLDIVVHILLFLKQSSMIGSRAMVGTLSKATFSRLYPNYKAM